MKNKKRISGFIPLLIGIISLIVGASFHGFRIHPENKSEYTIGVAMGIAMASLAGFSFVIFAVENFTYKRRKKLSIPILEESMSVGVDEKDSKFAGVHVSNIKLSKEIVNAKKYFKIGYCDEIKEYILAVYVCWIAGYYRYYKMNEEDYLLYENSSEEFCKKFKNEIEQKDDCFCNTFIGAGALRDYDGCKGFQYSYSATKENSFDGYGYYNGILYARIVWKDNITYVPPTQVIYLEDGTKYFPLREQCYIVKDLEGNDICYGLKL